MVTRIPSGDKYDLVRVCHEHRWASLPVPEEYKNEYVCPACSIGDADRRRYALYGRTINSRIVPLED